jgi:hypothetical protein
MVGAELVSFGAILPKYCRLSSFDAGEGKKVAGSFSGGVHLVVSRVAAQKGCASSIIEPFITVE